ncbi:MAG: ABC transporter permease [Candidatus Hydrogenedentes bacterium CG07_land_8_20_14_0_80_42_17]|nr:MAG: ABC transporter permease [Candidatus Hydrogenedentes bacterium CG07_land_8_20_14_0_80_42_17]
MNRKTFIFSKNSRFLTSLFHTISVSVAALLIFVIAAPLASALFEFLTYSMTKPMRMGDVFFAVKLSLMTATIASFLAIITALPVSWLLARKKIPGKIVIDTILDLPLVISPIALGAMLLLFFKTAPGEFIEELFGPFVFEVKGIILAQFVVIIGLAIRMIKSIFMEIDPEYETIARTLGVSEAGAFFKVSLPMAKSGIGSAFIMVWARALGEFGATVTLAGAMPLKTSTIPVAIYLSYGVADISSMMALILLAVIIAFIMLISMRALGSAKLKQVS